MELIIASLAITVIMLAIAMVRLLLKVVTQSHEISELNGRLWRIQKLASYDQEEKSYAYSVDQDSYYDEREYDTSLSRNRRRRR